LRAKGGGRGIYRVGVVVTTPRPDFSCRFPTTHGEGTEEEEEGEKRKYMPLEV
jgi:hypothetical protein